MKFSDYVKAFDSKALVEVLEAIKKDGVAIVYSWIPEYIYRVEEKLSNCAQKQKKFQSRRS